MQNKNQETFNQNGFSWAYNNLKSASSYDQNTSGWFEIGKMKGSETSGKDAKSMLALN